jgi:hypothetical protein
MYALTLTLNPTTNSPKPTQNKTPRSHQPKSMHIQPTHSPGMIDPPPEQTKDGPVARPHRKKHQKPHLRRAVVNAGCRPAFKCAENAELKHKRKPAFCESKMQPKIKCYASTDWDGGPARCALEGSSSTGVCRGVSSETFGEVRRDSSCISLIGEAASESLSSPSRDCL